MKATDLLDGKFPNIQSACLMWFFILAAGAWLGVATAAPFPILRFCAIWAFVWMLVEADDSRRQRR